VVLDGEAVVLRPDGMSDFGALQRTLKSGEDVAVVHLFDVTHLDGYDLSEVPLERRKQVLEALLAGATSDRLRYTDHIEGPREGILERACELGVEGLVSKRRDARYSPGRSRTWLKSKCRRRQEFAIVGYTDPSGMREGFGALALGYVDEFGGLAYAGRVGTGFDARTLRDLGARLRGATTDDVPLSEEPAAKDAKAVHWVRPELVAEVEFVEWTDDGRLRHPSFVGLREDKDPTAVVREREALPVPEPRVLEVDITHPERVVIPDAMTKLDLAAYYAAAAPHVLEHLADRPLTLLRCPEGSTGSCFWQRHVDEGTYPHVLSVPGGEEDWVAVRDARGLVELVQYLVVEFHAWGSRADRLDRPDRLVFDLDPGPDIGWDEVVAAAFTVREVLEAEGLQTFVKTSGGKGLHVYVPIERRVPVRNAAAATKELSEKAVAASDGLMTINPRKDARTGRIFVDWHRNGEGQSTVAPYVVRAREGAPVSTPIAWEELAHGVTPQDFTPDAVLARLEAVGDPWRHIGRVRQRLPQSTLPGL
jgi:bifunctional non-homologous end joining protein LigD